MEVSWIEYKDKKILFSNYDGCIIADEMINILYKERSILLQQEKKVLVMSNYNNSFGSPRYMEEVIKVGKITLKEHIAKTGVLGICGVKRILFNAYLRYSGQKNVRVFCTREEALEWLSSE